MSRPFLRYVLVTLGTVLVCGILLSLVFRGPGDGRAVWISATVAVAVQLMAFPLGRVAGLSGGLAARMGTGALVRFFAIVVYALLVVLVLHLPMTAALISLATFFFLSTVLEPVLIRS